MREQIGAMAVTIENLQERLVHIEQELSDVRRSLAYLTSDPTPQTESTWPDEIQWVDKAAWSTWFAQWFQQMDITVQPIGAEALQETMRQEGVPPEKNLLSHGIVAMRNE